MIEPFYKSVTSISKSFFMDPVNSQELFIKLKNCEIIIVREAVNAGSVRGIVSELLANPPPKSNHPRIIEGVENIYYESEPKKNEDISQSQYSAVDQSLYFFPWNQDPSGLYELIRPLFDQVCRINGFDPTETIRRTPKDGVVERLHLIFYPAGKGLISPHRDSIKVTTVTSGIYISEYGRDYNEGGFFLYDYEGKKIFVDHQIKSGDLLLFLANLPHGVDVNTFSGERSSKFSDYFDGRCFLNMTLVESHHVVDRETSRGI
jgi:hypothetical protein